MRAFRTPVLPFSHKVASYSVPRARHTRSSQFLDKARCAFSLDKTDDDNVEFLPLAFIDGIDEAIEPLSTFSFFPKEFQLLSIGGENAYLARLFALLFERFDKTADRFHFLNVATARAARCNVLLSVSDIDEVMQGRNAVLLGTSNDGQGQYAQ